MSNQETPPEKTSEFGPKSWPSPKPFYFTQRGITVTGIPVVSRFAGYRLTLDLKDNPLTARIGDVTGREEAKAVARWLYVQPAAVLEAVHATGLELGS
jgi:hypothetical protein